MASETEPTETLRDELETEDADGTVYVPPNSGIRVVSDADE